MTALKTKLIAVCGTGKDFRNRESTELAAGTEIGRRYDADGWHFFYATEYARQNLYAVGSAGVLDEALGMPGATKKAESIKRVRALMAELGVTVADLA